MMDRVPDKRYEFHQFEFDNEANLPDWSVDTPHGCSRLNQQESRRSDSWAELTDLIVSYVEIGAWDLIADILRPMLQNAPKTGSSAEHLAYLYKAYVFSLHVLGRNYDAVAVDREAMHRYPWDIDLKMLEGDILLATGDYRRALVCFETCWQMAGGTASGICSDTWKTSPYRTARQLGLSWLHLGDEVSARDWMFRAYEEDPSQPGLLPIIVLLTRDQDLLAEIEHSACVHGREQYEEFVEYYALGEFDDALHYIRQAEARWGETVATRRARFACAVRQGGTPVPALRTVNDPSQDVVIGLWYYEQGETRRALDCWAQAGEWGTTLADVVTAQVPREWRLAGLLKEFMAANAVKFLADFAPQLTDCHEVMPVLLQTGLTAGLQQDAYVNKSSVGSCTEQEWRTMVHMARGNWSMARQALVQASLPDGYLTVRGYGLQANLSGPRSHEILLKARSIYPTSKLLSSGYNPGVLSRMSGIV